jgi:hypothetical protein
MKNFNGLADLSRNRYARAGAAIASLTFLAGCAEAGKPHLVSGVPTQVDYKFSRDEYDASNPQLWPTVYYLGFEQCPADIKKAEAGQTVTTPSFNPDTHTYSPGCFVRQVEVAKTVYEEFTEGQTVTFAGKTGEPINRITG